VDREMYWSIANWIPGEMHIHDFLDGEPSEKLLPAILWLPMHLELLLPVVWMLPLPATSDWLPPVPFLDSESWREPVVIKTVHWQSGNEYEGWIAPDTLHWMPDKSVQCAQV
jgi:hypothetical protein